MMVLYSGELEGSIYKYEVQNQEQNANWFSLPLCVLLIPFYIIFIGTIATQKKAKKRGIKIVTCF